MTREDLQRLAASGEGTHLEFKRKVPRPERMAKEVVALANTRGGRLLLGVDDDGSVLGVRDAGEEEYSFVEAVGGMCTPEVRYTFERVEITHRRDAIVVDVPESREKPHFVVDPGTGRRVAYVRVDDMSIEASREAVRLMRKTRVDGGRPFAIGEKELLLMRYLEEYGRITVSQFARVAGIGRRQASGTLVRLTRAGLLALHPDLREDYFTRV